MNTAYRLIWDDRRNMLVIVDENSGARSKKGVGRVRRAALPAAALFALGLVAGVTMGEGEAWADATGTNAAVCMGADPGTGIRPPLGTATGNYSVACGQGATAEGNNSVAIGWNAATKRDNTGNAEANAYNTWQQIIKNDAEFASVTAVKNAKSYNALKNALTAVNSPTADAYVTQLEDTATKLKNTQIVPTAATSAVAVGDSATANGNNSVAVGRGAATGRNLTPTEAQSRAYSTLQKAIKNAFTEVDDVQKATDYNTLVTALSKVGSESAKNYLKQLSEMVIDLQAQAPPSSNNAVAVGYNANAGGTSAIAVGNNAKALKEDGTAANYAIAVGNNASAQAQDAIAVGRSANAQGQDAIAIGHSSGIATSQKELDTPNAGGHSIAIGNDAKNYTYGAKDSHSYYANAKNSIAIGYKAHTHASNAFAIGVSTDGTGERSFAIGTTATQVNTSHSGTRAAGQGSIAFGDQAMATTIWKRQREPGEEGLDREGLDRGADPRANDAIAMGTHALAQSRNGMAVGGGMSYTYHKADGSTVTAYYDGAKWVEAYDKAENNNAFIMAGHGTGALVEKGADGAVAIGGASAKVTDPNLTNDLRDISNYHPTELPTVDQSTYTKAAQATVPKSVALGTGSVANREAMKPIGGTAAPAYATSHGQGL